MIGSLASEAPSPLQLLSHLSRLLRSHIKVSDHHALIHTLHADHRAEEVLRFAFLKLEK